MNIGIDCNLLNTLQLISTSHSIPHATLFWWWQNQRNSKFYSGRTSKYYSGTFPYYKVPHRTQKYRKGLNCSPFDSHSTWNVQYIARSNLCDAKHNRITTFMFDSRNTWTSFTLGGATYGMQNATDLRHSVSQSQHMKRQLHCAEQPLGMQNAMEQWHSCLIIYIARSIRSPPSNFNKYCACHDKWPSWFVLVAHQYKWPSWLVFITHLKGPVQCAEHQESPSISLARKITFQNMRDICRQWLKRHLQCAAGPTMIRPRSAHEPVSTLNFTKYCSATKSDGWTSPNSAPATKNDPHDWSSSHMTRPV